MKHLRYVPGLVARGAAIAAALAAAGLPLAAAAQDLRGPLGRPAEAPAAPAPAPGGSVNLSESVAAVVNDDIISTYDLAQRMRLLIATSGVQPTQETLPQFQREALISLIDERLQFQELRRVGQERKINIIASDEEVDQDLAELAQSNNLRPEAFVGALRAQGINPETLRDQIRAQLSWRRWIQGYYGQRLRIGEDQVTLFQQRLAAAAAKPQYQISEVFIDATRVGGMQAAMAGAQQLVTQMQQGAPFPSVARQFSASATAASGGDAGWVSPGEMPPEVDAALEQLRPGQLSAPIQVRDGVYIVYLRDKRAGAGGTLVNLKQAAVALPQGASPGDEAAARVKLEAIRTQSKGCADIEAVAGRAQGVIAGDLGEAEVNDLIPAFQQAASQLQPGQVSEPIRSPAGLHVLAVCGKRAAGAAQLDREQIENRLFSQQLSMIARRAMRDLRTSATIETR